MEDIRGILTTGVVSLVLGYMVRLLQDRYSQRYQRAQSHFKDIKQQVIRPLLTALEQEYFPMLRLQKSYIYHGITIYEHESQRMVLRSLAPINLGAPGVNEVLFQDVKTNHYPKLVGMWENFSNQVNECNKDCVEYCSSLAEEVANGMSLEPWISEEQTHWHDPEGLAVYTLKRQLGIERNKLRLKMWENPPRLEDSTRILAQGTESQLNDCVSFIGSIVNDTPRIEPILSRLTKLHTEASHLETELQQVVVSQRLEGSCRYF